MHCENKTDEYTCGKSRQIQKYEKGENMDYLKKIIILFLVVAILMGMLGGCVTVSQAEKENDKDDITITVKASTRYIRDVDFELAEKFEKETGIKVEIQANPDDQYEKILMTCLDAGEGPDIFMGGTALDLQKYNPDTYALDLANEAWVEKYPDWILDQVSYRGKLVGFTTWGRDFRAMLYNKELFETYNIEVPVDYASFKTSCEKLIEVGVTPVYFPGKEEWYCSEIFNGAINIETKEPGTFEKLNKNETTYSESEEALKFLENLKDSAQCGYFGDDYLSNTFDQSVEKMVSGEYAMWFGWATLVNDIEAAGGPSADSFGAFPCPYTDDFSTVAMAACGITRMINQKSNHIEACKKYFDFLAEEENLKIFYQGRPDLLESTLEGVTVIPPRCYTEIMEQAENRTEPIINAVIQYNTSDRAFGENMQNMFLEKMTPEQVLDSLDQARQRMFEKEVGD